MSEMTLERACEILNDHRHAGQTDWEPNSGEAVSVGRGWAGYRIRWGAARAIETAMRLEREAPAPRDEVADVLASAMEAMGDAAQDLAEWRQLGRRWREESADSRDPKRPTDAGMERTEIVLKRIAVARLAIRRFGEGRDDAPTLLRWSSEPPSEPGLYVLNYHDPSIGDGGYKAEIVGPDMIERCNRNRDWWEGITSFGPIPESEDMR